MALKEYSLVEKSLAWSVHIFTASGLISGFLSILSIIEKDWRTAMFWLFVGLVIDGVDGTLARLFRVKNVLPKMDGKAIDTVVDFTNYVIIPAFFFYSADLVPESWNLICTTIILLASALYYGKEGMVSNDMYFIGFPVLWNLVVFYLIFVVQLHSVVNVGIVMFFAVLHFVPIKFAYPSRATKFKIPTLIMAIIFLLVMVTILYLFPERHFILTLSACICALYFGLLAIYNTYFE